MSFIGKLFGSRTTCPRCGSRYAKETFAGIKCPSPGCPNYERGNAAGEPPPAPPAGEGAPLIEVSPSATGDSIEIQYLNFRGETKVFTADPTSVRRKHQHVSLCVAPTGRRIALRWDRIANPAALVPHIPGEGIVPAPCERRVLRYHARRGTTSELYQTLRAKYPNWKE